MATKSSPKIAIYAALIGNVLVASTKAIAAAWTGSSGMLSEAVHSLVDTSNQVLLLYGMRRADMRPDRQHPLGYGRELYFWSFIVALLVFAVEAGVSVYERVVHLQNPEPITDPLVNYVVLGLAFLMEGTSWFISLRQFRNAKGTLSYYEAFVRSKDPTSFMVLFEDSAALIGIAIATLGTCASTALGAPMIDGVASILIGVVLATVSMLLARESKSLLVGEQADPQMRASILNIARDHCTCSHRNGLLTAQLAPDQILAALSLEFEDDLTAAKIEQEVLELERRIHDRHPEVVTLFVKPQTRTTFVERIRGRYGEPHQFGNVVTGPARVTSSSSASSRDC